MCVKNILRDTKQKTNIPRTKEWNTGAGDGWLLSYQNKHKYFHRIIYTRMQVRMETIWGSILSHHN